MSSFWPHNVRRIRILKIFLHLDSPMSWLCFHPYLAHSSHTNLLQIIFSQRTIKFTPQPPPTGYTVSTANDKSFQQPKYWPALTGSLCLQLPITQSYAYLDRCFHHFKNLCAKIFQNMVSNPVLMFFGNCELIHLIKMILRIFYWFWSNFKCNILSNLLREGFKKKKHWKCDHFPFQSPSKKSKQI